ncbi:MAG: hypothetical protein ACM3SP_07945 [Chloroflexota bacterium]
MPLSGCAKPRTDARIEPPKLTSRDDYVIKTLMHREPLPMKQSRLPRWVTAVLLLTVFFLPLHFHAVTAAASQLTKECTCLQGTRTQVDLSDTAPACVPTIAYYAVMGVLQDQFDSQSVRQPSSRGPPPPVSL